MPPEPTPLHDKYKLPPGTFPLKIQKKVHDKEGLDTIIPSERLLQLAGAKLSPSPASYSGGS